MLSAGQKAFMPCVSGTARSAATRSAYLLGYQPMVGLIQGGRRFNLTPYVRHGSVHISQHLNADIDTATLQLVPGYFKQPPYAPRVRADGASYHWRFNESVGMTTYETIVGETATLIANARLNQPGVLPDNTALEFLSASGFVETVATARPWHTLELWFRATAGAAANTYNTLYHDAFTTPNGRVIRVPMGTAGTVQFITVNAGALGIVTSVRANLYDQEWHHLVVVNVGTTYALYLDGVLDSSGTIAAAGVSTSKARFGYDAESFVGTLDELALYPGPLTATQIAAHYEAAMLPVPTPRARIEIAMGNPSAVEFAGEIMTVQESRVPMTAGPQRDHRPFIDLTCTDWLDVFDAALVTDAWPPQSATITVKDLITRYTRGGPSGLAFGTNFVEADMPSLPTVEAFNERPSTVLQRILNLAAAAYGSGSGGFYIDTQREVHAWALFDPGRVSNPQVLQESEDSLKSFRRVTDGAQQRTRVFVEGARTETLMPLPAITPPATVPDGGYFSVPLAAGVWLPRSYPLPGYPLPGYIPGVTYNTRLVRIGSVLCAYRETSVFPVPASGNYPVVTLTQAATPGDAYLIVTTKGPEWPTLGEGSTAAWKGYVKVGDQFVAVSDNGPNGFMVDPFVYSSFGSGRLQSYAPVGTPVTPTPACLFQCYVLTRPVEGALVDPSAIPHRVKYRGFGRYFGPLPAMPAGTPVVLVDLWQSEDTVAAEIATLEGGDGWHEHIVQDGRFYYPTAEQRAKAEVLNFEHPTVAYEWDTEDRNAAPGRRQEIYLVDGPQDIYDEVTITDVEITWPVESRPPLRSCRAATTRAIQILDAWLTDTK